MNYNLTEFLTTVSAASASIVAILGGFIASKLIAINGERSGVIDKLNSIEEELRFKKERLKKCQKENDSDDALSFIREHIDNVFNLRPIDDVYDTAESQCITKESLQEFWDKALALRQELETSLLSVAEWNSDSLPKNIARKYSEDSFSYDVLVELTQYMKRLKKDDERRRHEEERRKNPSLSIIGPAFDYAKMLDSVAEMRPTISNWSYSQNEKDIASLNSDIPQLEFQKKQLEEQRKTLVQPKGMNNGLIIFALFAFFCIIVPLAMSPCYTESACEFWIIKIIILTFFIGGLAAIFVYLVALLQWKNESK